MNHTFHLCDFSQVIIWVDLKISIKIKYDLIDKWLISHTVFQEHISKFNLLNMPINMLNKQEQMMNFTTCYIIISFSFCVKFPALNDIKCQFLKIQMTALKIKLHLFAKTYAPLCSLKHYSWLPRHGNNQNVL